MNTNSYVVYVEDDEDDLLLMEEIMDKQEEVNLVTVNDGQELLDFLEDQRDGDLPCLIIMDNNTPRMSGIETAKKLKKDDLYSSLQLILLTTALSKTDEAFCLQNNISIYIKPSTFPDWEALARQLINRCSTAKKIAK